MKNVQKGFWFPHKHSIEQQHAQDQTLVWHLGRANLAN